MALLTVPEFLDLPNAQNKSRPDIPYCPKIKPVNHQKHGEGYLVSLGLGVYMLTEDNEESWSLSIFTSLRTSQIAQKMS